MFRAALWFICVLLLGPTSTAQQLAQSRPLLSPVRDAGTYHIATGTWTRTGAGANLGPDVIFSATAPSGYFATNWEGAEAVDEGILPGPGNPLDGPNSCYVISGFQFAYCSNAISIDWSFTFYDSYVPCAAPGQPCTNLAGSTALTGMPTAGACWVVTVDLSGGNEIDMQAEGGICAPGYQGAASGLDHFGWGAVWNTLTGAPSGPLVSGYDPTWSGEGEGTCYNTGLTCPAGATGLGAQDMFGIGTPFSGCFWFGGYENVNGCGGPARTRGGQFHLELYTDCANPCPGLCWTSFCAVNNNGTLAITDCLLSANPLLVTTGLPVTAQFAYHLIGQGSAVISNPPGAQGDLCLGGAPIGRYNADVGPVVGQAFSTDLVNGATGGGGGNLPNPPGGTLAPGQTWNFQTWYRIGPGQSGFSEAITMTFL
jgi:hypothetical protein